MIGVFRTPLLGAAVALVVGLGSLTMTARPAAALTDREALGLALGIGAAAILLDNDKDRRSYREPPRPRYYDSRERYDRYYDRGPREVYVVRPDRRWDRGWHDNGHHKGWYKQRGRDRDWD